MAGWVKLVCVLVAIVVIGILSLADSKPVYSVPAGTDNSRKISSVSALTNRILLKADFAKAYCKQHAFNTDYCFLVDFSLHSGKKRFFVWDFKGDSIKLSSLCAHGYGLSSTVSEPEFSNVEGSYCSSLGKYKVGIRSYSQWGIHVHYKLHGLEKTNSKAYKRTIVLHSFGAIPDTETYPTHLPLGMSQGCPVISDETMKQVDKMQKSAEKTTLLWIYN